MAASDVAPDIFAGSATEKKRGFLNLAWYLGTFTFGANKLKSHGKLGFSNSKGREIWSYMSKQVMARGGIASRGENFSRGGIA